MKLSNRATQTEDYNEEEPGIPWFWAPGKKKPMDMIYYRQPEQNAFKGYIEPFSGSGEKSSEQ
jgi:hypothetical protein